MTAVLIATDGHDRWLAERRKGITASEIAVVMGLSPYSSPFALYHQKTGDLPGPDDNMAMALGRHLEDFVARQFTALHPEFQTWSDGRALYQHPERPWQLATPDRLLTEGGHWTSDLVAVLECKTSATYDGWGDDGTDEIPVHYRCQVLWQMDVMGVSTGFVACLFLHSRQLRVYEITLDIHAAGDLALMRHHALLFLDRVAQGNPPDVDWRPATGNALKRLHPDLEDRDVYVPHQHAKWYRAACRDIKAAEQRKQLYENKLRARLGNGHRLIDDKTGEVIARRDVYDVKEHTRKASHVDKLVPVKPKETS